MARKQLKHLYLIYSHDRLFVDQALGRLQAQFEQGGGLDKSVFNAREDDIDEVINIARTPSLLASQRLLILADIDKLLKAELSALKEYAASPSPDSLLVMTALTAKPSYGDDKMSSLDKALKRLPKELAGLIKVVDANGQVFEFGAPTARETPRWLRDELKNRGVSISPGALEYLAHTAGNDFTVLAGEMDKISLYAEPGQEIGLDDVRGLVSPSSQSGVFDLVNALCERKHQQAFIVLERLLDQGEPGMKLISMLGGHFRMLIQIRSLLDEGVPQRQLSSHMPDKNPWQITKNVGAAQSFSMGELKNAYSWVLDSDIAIKTGHFDEQTAIELLCSRICGR